MPHQKIREKINKACPDLLKLKFGCEVETKFDGNMFYTGANFNGAIFTKGGSSIIVNEKEIVKILGREPGLADVLRAIEKRPGPDMFFVAGHWPDGIKITDSVTFAYGAVPGILKLWDFTKTFSEQSNELMEWLEGVI